MRWGTERLILQHFTLNDAEYVVRQLNERSFIENIADKKVRHLADAENYLTKGPLASYKKFGFGLNIVLEKSTHTAIGMCGLLKRDELKHPDLGFAFLPEYWGQGYALEASQSVLKDAVENHSLDTILAITSPRNAASNRLLTRLKFRPKGLTEFQNQKNNIYEYHVKASDQPTVNKI